MVFIFYSKFCCYITNPLPTRIHCKSVGRWVFQVEEVPVPIYESSQCKEFFMFRVCLQFKHEMNHDYTSISLILYQQPQSIRCKRVVRIQESSNEEKWLQWEGCTLKQTPRNVLQKDPQAFLMAECS